MPVFLESDALFARVARAQGAECADAMRALFSPTLLIVFHVANALFAVGAAWVAMRIVRTHFAKANPL